MIAETWRSDPVPNVISGREHGGVTVLAASFFLAGLRPQRSRVVVMPGKIRPPQLFLVGTSAIAAGRADPGGELGIGVPAGAGRLECAVSVGNESSGRGPSTLLHLYVSSW